ncbi:MAG TPA: hypothetical protein VN694_14745 [Caulobacteraceae bacterium]|nr:hypothetical protein [Caulobacteraceae bacterium]
MSAENDVAAPAELASFEFVSPWPTSLRTGLARRWLSWLADAWRESLQLYVRAMMVRGHWQGWL